MRRRNLLMSLPAVAVLPRPLRARTANAGEPIRLGQSAPVSGPLAQVGRASGLRRPVSRLWGKEQAPADCSIC